MKKIMIKKVASILLAFAVLYSGVPLLVGSTEAEAATAYWKDIKISATAYTKNTVTWKALTKAQQKRISGIAVFRGTTTKNMKVLVRTKKGSAKYIDVKAKTGTKYCYQLKTYTTKKVNQKQYYNKSTKKWVAQKPAAKYWGKCPSGAYKGKKTRTVKVIQYKYANASPIKWITTKKKPVVTTTPTPGPITGLKTISISENSISISWDKLSINVTGYQVCLNGSLYRELDSGTNTLAIKNLSSNTSYTIKVRGYYTESTSTYGGYAQISAKTSSTTSSGENTSSGNEAGGNNTNGSNETGGFDYQNIPLNPSEIQIGDGTYISKNINTNLKALSDNWMNQNLPADATDEEKVNLCIKAISELKNTPESIAIVGNPTDWVGINECFRWATYFDTVCASAGITSATRNCTYDQEYGVPFGQNHIVNFVWINGAGYIIEINNNKTAKATLSVINYDWTNWHAVATNTRFDCRYY